MEMALGQPNSTTRRSLDPHYDLVTDMGAVRHMKVFPSASCFVAQRFCVAGQSRLGGTAKAGHGMAKLACKTGGRGGKISG